MIIVPGVGFDPQGNRLGRGRGFYDRLLVDVNGIKCGIAFDRQVTESIPTETHDARMDYIITPSRCLDIAHPTPAI